jgi:2-iminobutanoate/2-iminopropanoate deaminase
MSATQGKETVLTSNAPKPIGPYSQAIRTPELVFASGQAGLDPASGKLVEGGIEAQTRQVLTNISNVLQAADSELGLVVKTTVFLKNMSDFPRMNAIYAEFFSTQPPARTTIAAAELPLNALVEIEAIALCRTARA